MPRFGQYIRLIHPQRYHAHYHTTGQGHLYQRHYKSFPLHWADHRRVAIRLSRKTHDGAELVWAHSCSASEQWLDLLKSSLSQRPN